MIRRCFALLLVLLLIPAALAEGNAVLPMDFSAAPAPNPDLFTENGYEDETITVQMSREEIGDARFNIARVKIKDASQLRIGLSADFGKKKTNRISTMAKNQNAVVAIGGDYYLNEEGGYVVRMGETYRKKPLKSRDMLITDDAGDFHILKNSDPAQLKALLSGERKIVNVFNFGPALVIDGKLQDMPEKYNYNIHGKEPRCAIGQLGTLEYLLVVVDGRGAAGSDGCTVAELAQFMADQGCVQAYNLDGGNSALMVFGRNNYSQKTVKAERSVSDIIYFATAVGAEE